MIYLVPIILSALTWSMQSAFNGAFYAKGSTRARWPVNRFADNLHRLQNIFRTLYWLTIASWLFPILQMPAKLDHPIIQIFFSLVFGHAILRTVNVVWQGWINLGSGLPFIDPNEASRWELIIGRTGVWIPKWGRSWMRIVNSIFFGLAYPECASTT